MSIGLVEVAEYGNRPEAELTVSLLASHGIEAMLKADDCGGFYASQTFTIGVKVMVSADDYAAAKELLDHPADYPDESPDDDSEGSPDDIDAVEAEDGPVN